MKLIATMPARNEGWIIGLSARVALMWCDEIVILNHASTDDTAERIGELQEQHPFRVHVISVPEAQWSEMRHRQDMLDLARTKGATHIAIIDADEILTPDLFNFPRSALLKPNDGQILQLPGYNLRCSLNRYHLNGLWGDRWFSVAFADNPRFYWASWGRDQYDHHHREPFGMTCQSYRPVGQGRGGVMHLWGVTDRRLRAKHALYKVTERLRWPEKPIKEIDRMYSLWKTGSHPNEPNTWQFADVPKAWWEPYEDLVAKYLHVDAEPWQENEVRRLIDKHGPERFRGLDLFGIA